MIPEPVFLFFSGFFLMAAGAGLYHLYQKRAEREARHRRIGRDIREGPRL